jgi:hypothetical protein
MNLVHKNLRIFAGAKVANNFETRKFFFQKLSFARQKAIERCKKQLKVLWNKLK